ncbi:unnamed protein product, partial [Ixodes persulcatus]
LNGINSPTLLIQLKGLDVVWRFSPDYMHAILECVIRQLTGLRITCTSGAFYNGAKITEINAPICKIKPHIGFLLSPSLSNRASIVESERVESVSAFLCFALLVQHSTHSVLQTLFMLPQAVFLLIKETLTKQDIHISEDKLTKFVRKCVLLYKEPAATFNVHILLHLPTSVQMLGLLWGTSTFPYESNN